MKFISKQSNYRVVLQQGQPAEPLTGRAAVPGKYVKFENGVANVIDEKMCEMMMQSVAFNRDFILAEENTRDPWEDVRAESEPEHSIMDLKYGTVAENVNPRARLPLNKDQQKIVKEMAREMAVQMAKEMAPQMAKEILKEVVEKNVANKKKGGRPPKVKEGVEENATTEEVKTTDEVK